MSDIDEESQQIYNEFIAKFLELGVADRQVCYKIMMVWKLRSQGKESAKIEDFVPPPILLVLEEYLKLRKYKLDKEQDINNEILFFDNLFKDLEGKLVAESGNSMDE